MFGMFPFRMGNGNGNIISFTSFTSFTSTSDGINGYNVTNGYSGFYDPDQLNNNIPNINSLNYNNSLNGMNILEEIQSAVTNVLENVDIQELAERYYNILSTAEGKNRIEDNKENNNCDFIELERNNDMYILKIKMLGIDLRELSIRYDPGILDINLKKLEYDNNSYNRGCTNNPIKKKYNTTFINIEEIDTERVLKSIDNGIFIMKMPKKYILDSSSKIVEVESYKVEEENNKVIPRM